MKQTISSLARQIGAQPAGEESLSIHALVSLDEANSTSLSPLFNKNAFKDAKELPGAVLTDPRIADWAIDRGVRAAIVHENPVLALAALIDIFFPEESLAFGVHPAAVVHPDARLHSTVQVGACAVVEAHVTVDAGSVIGPGAILCKGAVVGRNVRIGPGAVIGHEGFGFVPTAEGLVKVRQVGCVVIEDDVEIGANACVDRGTLGTTRIGRGAKLDNLVQIGHNARIGRSVILAGQVGVAGSAVIEDRAMLGGQVGIADHLTVGEGAKVAAKSGVTANVPAGAVVAGYPAMPRMRWLRFFAEVAAGRKGPQPRVGTERKGRDDP